MKILNVSHLADTAGDGWRTKQAFGRVLPHWDYRTACRVRNYIDYPRDLVWTDAYAHWLSSDVVHLREGFTSQEYLDAPDRPMVIHHHGTEYRKNKRNLLCEQRQRKAIGLAATLDLYLDAPDDLRWLPAPFDVRSLHRMREMAEQPRDSVFRIGHNPTNRRWKSTDLLIQAVEKLKSDLQIELVLVEKQPWSTSLRAKTTIDVYFDQVKLGYGNNAIESWSMGVPVIAGAAEPTLHEMRYRFGDLPFYRAEESVSSIARAIEALADPMTHAKWSARGRKHVQQWHSEEVVVPMLQRIYEEAAR